MGMANLWSILAPRVGQVDICARGHFCTKFTSKQLLFEAFFDVMRTFGSIEPHSESNFPFLYVIRFLTYWSWEPPSSTHGGETYAVADFFVQNSISNNFYLKLFFDVMRIFGSVEPQTEHTFPFQYIITFKIRTFYQPCDVTIRIHVGE